MLDTTEFEAKFYFIDKEAFRLNLQKNGAKLVSPERMMKRAIYQSTAKSQINGHYARVRDEGFDQVTMSIKTNAQQGGKMSDQKEICLKIDSFEVGRLFLENLNLEQKAYQESLRETWFLDGAEIVIETWPHLDPYIEIESSSEDKVWDLAKKLEVFDLNKTFSGAGFLYSQVYGVEEKIVNDETKLLVFDQKPVWVR